VQLQFSFNPAAAYADARSSPTAAVSPIRRAPGRVRTDTGDPFRGSASALGLRGLGNRTSVPGSFRYPLLECHVTSLPKFFAGAFDFPRVRAASPCPAYSPGACKPPVRGPRAARRPPAGRPHADCADRSGASASRPGLRQRSGRTGIRRFRTGLCVSIPESPNAHHAEAGTSAHEYSFASLRNGT
jgi:hypothetical protein